ncbi:MAG: hypothetical protein KGI80_02595 [Verrucomicrobiota bacterium]|nr:hypothetical protein [Verrucomicrobiota bacterium]
MKSSTRLDLEPAKAVLRQFLADIEAVKKIRRNMSIPQMATAFSVIDKMPIFDSTEFTPDSDAYWAKDDAYTWIYGATRYHPLMHRMG